jgi:hypothetical protein
MFAIKACKGWRTKAQDVSIMTLNNTKEHSVSVARECDRSEATTNPSDLSTLDDQSLEVLIQHYLSVKERLPDNLRVRDRLVELQQELLNRTLKADAESEANNRTNKE